jgi:hypothetical protein
MSATMLGAAVAGPVADAASTPVSIAIARYAAATAAHGRPRHAVDAADVANAVATTLVNTAGLGLVFNLDQLPGLSREIGLVNPTTYRWTCILFPDRVGAAPRVVACSASTMLMPAMAISALDMSRNVVAAAARRGRAVDGAEVAKAASADHQRLVAVPKFRSGEGGRVKFVGKGKTDGGTSTVYVCVLMPKTPYGIPVQVAC